MQAHVGCTYVVVNLHTAVFLTIIIDYLLLEQKTMAAVHNCL